MKYGPFTVRANDLVTIRTPQGQLRTGRVQPLLLSTTHCVLNMGGRYGTPAVADASNIVTVSPRKGA